MKNRRLKRSNIKSGNGRLRLSVFKSNVNIYAQVIDDSQNATIVAASSLKVVGKNGKEKAEIVGREIAEAAKAKKIQKVVFDRGNYVFRGKIKALAESARKNGLEF